MQQVFQPRSLQVKYKAILAALNGGSRKRGSRANLCGVIYGLARTSQHGWFATGLFSYVFFLLKLPEIQTRDVPPSRAL